MGCRPNDLDLTAEQVRKLLDYDPDTGVFTWRERKRNAYFLGKVAGKTLYDGYIQIRILGIAYKAHRLAWLHYYGTHPADHLDHINRDRSDNRIANLRPATPFQNNGNVSLSRSNTSGFKGVTWHKPSKRWRAAIRVSGRAICLGYFMNPEEAHRAYIASARKHFGEFATDGRASA